MLPCMHSWQRYIGTKRVGWHYETWPELKFVVAAGEADWMCRQSLWFTLALARALMPDTLHTQQFSLLIP